PATSDRLSSPLSRVMPEYLVYPLSGSLLAIFPTALLMGIAFPIGLRLWAGAGGDSGHVARRVGVFYSLNVAAAIAGSLAGGFALLPRIGSRASIAVLSAATLASGVALLAVADWRASTRWLAGVLAAATFAAIVAGSADPFREFIAQRFRG